MTKNSILNLKSLKEQVYEYLRIQLETGEIRPGSVINIEKTSTQLGVSRTPLRDALLQLEMEGFVSIIPRKGVVVKHLTLESIKESYGIIGALESTALLSVFDKINTPLIRKMQKLNSDMVQSIDRDNFNLYYRKNLEFHSIFLNLCTNKSLVKIVTNLKKRLYDFPRQEGFVKQWEKTSIQEHEELVRLIAEGKKEEAAGYIRDVHWSYEVQEKFIKKYYKKAAAAANKNIW
jgi:DNA-binding GntR family transcriptional regulator